MPCYCCPTPCALTYALLKYICVKVPKAWVCSGRGAALSGRRKLTEDCHEKDINQHSRSTSSYGLEIPMEIENVESSEQFPALNSENFSET